MQVALYTALATKLAIIESKKIDQNQVGIDRHQASVKLIVSKFFGESIIKHIVRIDVMASSRNQLVFTVNTPTKKNQKEWRRHVVRVKPDFIKQLQVTVTGSGMRLLKEEIKSYMMEHLLQIVDYRELLTSNEFQPK